MYLKRAPFRDGKERSEIKSDNKAREDREDDCEVSRVPRTIWMLIKGKDDQCCQLTDGLCNQTNRESPLDAVFAIAVFGFMTRQTCHN